MTGGEPGRDDGEVCRFALLFCPVELSFTPNGEAPEEGEDIDERGEINRRPG